LISLEWTLEKNSVETHTKTTYQGSTKALSVKQKEEMFEYPLDIIVYPNSVTASFTVYLSATFDSLLNADLYDITGRMVAFRHK
jgi:hypothetical protein